MPYQNRVAPDGEIFRSSARGTFMGNRGGALHNEHREIVRRFTSRRWITCLLEFKGRRRTVMTPGLYTELFFLDEAVSLAAGHRPCAECRRKRFEEFRDAWLAWNPPALPRFVGASDIDAVLHPARIDKRGSKVTWEAPLASLPDGSFIRIEGASYLLWRGAVLSWSPSGYTGKRTFEANSMVTVLTPEPLVQCLRHGFTPAVHESALSL